MLEQTLESANVNMLPAGQQAASPFEDLAAVHALYEQRLFRFLLLSTRDRDLALSLTQDSFLQAWRNRAQFRGDCSVYTWLTRIALNLLRSHTRTETFRFWKRAANNAVDAKELASSLPANGRTPEQQLIGRESLETVFATVEQLSARQRAVFLLRYVEELELSEIAEATGLPLPTVKAHLYRGLDRIRAAHPEVLYRKERQ